MMGNSFQQQVAIVTGGAGGIGGALTRALLDLGSTVVCADRSEPHVPEGCADVSRFHPAVVDVSSRPQVRSLVGAAVRTHGRVDLLVNVAGVVSFGPAESIDEAEWDRVIDINLKGTFLCCQSVMSPMRTRGYGRIVNIGSVIGKNGGNARPWIAPDEQARSGNAAYGASKAGVHALTGFFAKELARHGVTVNAVAPGPVASAMTKELPASLKSLIPVGRMGDFGDVVRAILFLASPEAGFINGEVLDVNGGMWCD